MLGLFPYTLACLTKCLENHNNVKIKRYTAWVTCPGSVLTEYFMNGMCGVIAKICLFNSLVG